MYVFPVGAAYVQNDILESFYQELESFTQSCKYVSLLGDFNARKASLTDVTLTDNDIFEQTGINVESVYSLDIADQLKELEANLDNHRVSKDVKVNEFGRNIVEFYKSNDMIILNGRVFHDKGIGKTTYKDKSEVDYIIISSVKFVSNFEDKVYCVLFSDALEMSMNAICKEMPAKDTPKSTKVKACEETK